MQTGSYILLLHLPSDTELDIPHLGTITFPAGFYAYAASAFDAAGLPGHIKRHLAPAKQPRQDIDYLVQVASIDEVWMALGNTPREHDWTDLLLAIPGGISLIDGFGVTGCACDSHLVYFDVCPSLEDFEVDARHKFPTETIIGAVTGNGKKHKA